MNLISEFKENELFEKTLRSIYPENICNIVIEWTDEALRYIFKKTEKKNAFKLGRFNTITKEIEYSNEFYTCEEVINRVIREMEYALDDKGNESRDIIEEELKTLSAAL